MYDDTADLESRVQAEARAPFPREQKQGGQEEADIARAPPAPPMSAAIRHAMHEIALDGEGDGEGEGEGEGSTLDGVRGCCDEHSEHVAGCGHGHGHEHSVEGETVIPAL